MKPKLRSWLICWLAAGAIGWGQPARIPPQEGRPLPQIEAFLERVKQNLTSDRLLQSQYTFNRTETVQAIDRQGEAKRTWSKTWEVFPSVEPKLSYERLIEKDGEPIKVSRIEKQDREHRKKRENLKRLSPERVAEKHQEEKQKEQRQLEEVFRLFRFRIQRRATIDGISTIVVSFEPRASYRPKIKSVRPLRNMQGEAWICEDDYRLTKVEIELMKAVSLAWGAVARLHRGARIRFTRRKVNGEIWLPSESYFLGSGRVLLVKLFRVEIRNRYSDYRKFTVQDSVDYASDPISSSVE